MSTPHTKNFCPTCGQKMPTMPSVPQPIDPDAAPAPEDQVEPIKPPPTPTVGAGPAHTSVVIVNPTPTQRKAARVAEHKHRTQK